MKWPMVKLGDLIIQDVGGISLKRDQFTDSGTIVVPKKAISSDVNIDHSNLVYTSKKTAIAYENYKADNSFLITTLRDLVPTGPNLGRICEINVSEPFLLAQGVYAFKLNDLVCPKFITYYSNSIEFRKQLLCSKVGSTQVHIRSGDFKAAKIPLPPLEEQKRIAAILDKADAIRRKRQQAIKLADEFLRSVFLDMFGDPVTNPKGWEVRPVGKICDCIVPGRDKPKSFTGSTPWITTNELSHLTATLKRDDFIGLTDEEIKEVKAKVIPKGSVIMTCVGDLGVVSIAGESMVINQQLHAFLPSELITPSFLSYALSWQKGYMVRMASSTTVPYMNKTVCNSIPVILPPKKLQEKFDLIVERVRENNLSVRRFGHAFLFESLSQKAFTGEL